MRDAIGDAVPGPIDATGVQRSILLVVGVSAGIYFFLHAHLLMRIFRDWARHPLVSAATHPRSAALDEGLPGYAAIGFWLLAAAGFTAMRLARRLVAAGRAMQWVAGLLGFCAALILPFQLIGYIALAGIDLHLAPPTLWLASLATTFGVVLMTRSVPDRPDPAPVAEPLDLLSKASLGVALVGLSLCGIDSLIVGPRHFDALWYHVPTMVEWFQDRPLAPPSWWSSENLTVEGLTHWYPANAHCLGFVMLCLPAGARLVSLMQMPLLALAAASLYGSARLLGHTRPNALLAPLTLLCIPLVVDQAVQPLVDVGVAAFVSTAVYALLHLGIRGAEQRPAVLLLLATASGLAVGTKLNAIPIIGVLLLAAMGFLATDRDFRIRDLCWPAVALGMTGAFWFVRNFVLLGYWNPYEFALLRVAEFPRLYASIADLLIKSWSETNFGPWSGLGPVYLTLVPAGLLGIFLLPSTPPLRTLRIVLGALLLSVLPWWFSSWRTLHYVIYAITLSCLVAPYAASCLSTRRAAALRGFVVAAAFVAQMLNCDAVMFLGNQPSVYPWFQPSRPFVACLDALPPGRCMLFADSRIEDVAGERVVDNLTFFLGGSKFQRGTVLPDLVQLARLQFALRHQQPARFAELMAQMDVTYLVMRVLPSQNLTFYSECGLREVCRFDYPLFSDVVYTAAAAPRERIEREARHGDAVEHPSRR